nr:copia protein [Tanacetum cinerariifolium]
MFLSQRKYATEILKPAHMVGCNFSQTPVDIESNLGDDGDPVSDSTSYRSLAGSLQDFTFTRPDISYDVQQLFSSSTTSLASYSDADLAGCPTTRRSTSGYCIFLGNNLLSWSSKRQSTLSRSSAEAEYRGVANVVAGTCWLRNLLRELHTHLSSATLLYCDDTSAVYLSSNPVQHQRTKHIEIDIHFVRDLIAAGQVQVFYVPSRYQYADIFTKGLPFALFEEFHISLSVRRPPALTAKEWMFLSQRKYATEILKPAHMVGCNFSQTPVDIESNLGDDGDPVSDSTSYRSLAGSLQDFTFTRPDISYDVQQVCLYMHDPQEPHLSSLKWILCAEAEYRGVANVVAGTCWLRNLLRELHTHLSSATLLYCDDISAVYLSSNPVQHQRTKHIEIDIHFVRDLIAAGQVRVFYVPSRYQYADIFTKGLPSALFEEFHISLSVRRPPALTAEEC